MKYLFAAIVTVVVLAGIVGIAIGGVLLLERLAARMEKRDGCGR